MGTARHASQTGNITPEVLAYEAVPPEVPDESTAQTLALEAPPMHLQEAGHPTIATPSVPFYSQFHDITSPSWQKVGCGITSLAMVIAYYRPGTASVDQLLARGIARNAYLEGVGWTYRGLIDVATEYGFAGKGYDFAVLAMPEAFAHFERALLDGPVITSVHYKFDPYNPISHLVVVNRIDGTSLHYNDPAEKSGGGVISTDAFVAAWKKRYIVVRPTF